ITPKEKNAANDDLKSTRSIATDKTELALRLAQDYELASKKDEAQRIYEKIGQAVHPPTPKLPGVLNVRGSAEDIAAANADDPKVALPALEKLMAANPKNAGLFARLGEVTRRLDPQ